MTLMSDSDWVDATIVSAVFRADYHIALLAILGALLLLSALLLALFARDPKRRYQPQNLWALSSGFSILCVLTVLAIWVLLSIAAFPQGSGSPVLSQQDLDSYLAAQPAAPAEQPRILIPIGVFVQTIEFTTAFDPIVSGVIWQVYGPGVPQEVMRGFVLPDASDAQITESYRVTRGDAQVIGWSFRATLRQSFQYDTYPFDRHFFWVRVFPADQTHNIVLTPDFAAYSSMRPQDMPGIASTFVLENWDVKQTFFSYHTEVYNTNLGIATSTRPAEYPALYYTICMSRQILTPVIIYVVPPLIALVMLFGILLLTTRSQERRASAGWNSTNVLAYCAAVFFVVIVSQVNLRQQINTSGILYLDWFYLLTYCAILLVAINAVVFILASERRIIQHEDNLIAKLLYWPVLTSAMLVITVLVFLP